MKIVIHRGTHQIGGCATEFVVDDERILIDCGANLPGTDENSVISDEALCEKLFESNSDKIKAVLYTHYHGDHCGLRNKVPLDTRQFIGKIAKNIMYIVATYIDRDNLNRIRDIRTYCSNLPVRIDSDKFEIIPFYTDHSALDAYMFLIKAEGKTILFTGDFREHGIVGENDRFRRVVKKYVPRNIDLLITEGTMISRQDEVKVNKIRTEEELGKRAAEIFVEHKYNYVLVSSTNLDSIMEFYHNTPANKKFVCDYYQAKLIATAMSGMNKRGNYPLYQASKNHPEIYILDYTKDRADVLSKLMQGMKRPVKWLAANEFDWKDEEFVMLVRKNSYPENGPNCFERIRDSLPKEDSYIVYSMWIGYLSEDKEDKAIRAFIDGYSWEPLHTSGHAYVETIADLIKLVNPMKIIPMHSENPEEFCNIPILENYRERIQIMEDGVEFEI